jgi:RimJ/RimL family protein N-acetyltransferase
MSYSISPLTPENARRMINWQYDPPYDFYDLAQEHLPGLLNPDYRYHQVLNRPGELAGFCCFGEDARVPGGGYSEGEPRVLDIGLGLKPELTGRGLGKDFVAAVLNYARDNYQPEIYRVTIADFNQRSQKTFQSLGFNICDHFTRDPVEVKFTQLERSVIKE